MRRAILALGLLALVACDTSEDGVPAGDAPQEPETALGPKDMLDLEAGGLTVPAHDGDEIMHVPFGSNRAAAEATLATVLGEVASRDAGEGDCWLQSTSYEGMQLNFSEDRFVGYFARAPYVPEVSRSQMLADPGVEMVVDSTIDGEFTIGEPEGAIISGVFEDEDVGALWAGENCIFR